MATTSCAPVSNEDHDIKKRMAMQDLKSVPSNSVPIRLTKMQAYQLVSIAAPIPPKKESAYVRFKAAVAAEALTNKKRLTAKEIRDAWYTIEDIDVSHLDVESCTHYEYIKFRAEERRGREAQMYEDAQEDWCISFDKGAAAYLAWLILDLDASNVDSLNEAIAKIEAIGNGRSCREDTRAYTDVLQRAKEAASTIQDQLRGDQLFDHLRCASDNELRQHIHQHLAAIDTAALVDSLKTEKLILHAEAEKMKMEGVSADVV